MAPSTLLGNGLLFAKLHVPEPAKRVVLQALLERVTIDRLGRRRSLSRRDDHLAVRGGDTTGRIKPRHRRAHAMIDFDLAIFIDARAELLRQLRVEISPRVVKI